MSPPTIARIALAALLLSIWASLGVARTVTNALRDANLLRVTVAVLFGVAAAVSLVWILRDARNRSLRVLAALGGVGALYAAIVLPMSSPEEKAHFVEYGAVALLAWAALPSRWSTGRRLGAAALFTLGAGWIDEGIQALLPSRYYDLRDVAFNGAAGLLALGALQWVRWARGPSAAPGVGAAPAPLAASSTPAKTASDAAPSAGPAPGSPRSPPA